MTSNFISGVVTATTTSTPTPSPSPTHSHTHSHTHSPTITLHPVDFTHSTALTHLPPLTHSTTIAPIGHSYFLKLQHTPLTTMTHLTLLLSSFLQTLLLKISTNSHITKYSDYQLLEILLIDILYEKLITKQCYCTIQTRCTVMVTQKKSVVQYF
jgi:hypothetical protein